MRFFSPVHADLITVKQNQNKSYTVEINHDAVLAHFYSDTQKKDAHSTLRAAVIIANLFSNMDFTYKNEASKSVLTLSPREIEKLTEQLQAIGFQRDYQPRSRDLALMSTEKHTEMVREGRMSALALELSTGIHTQQAKILAENHRICR